MSDTEEGIQAEAAAVVPEPKPQGLYASIAMTLTVLAVGFAVFGFGPGALVSLYAGMVATYVAVPYTVLAIIVREVVAHRTWRGDDDEPRNAEAIRFGLFRQRASFVTAVTMLAAFAVLVVVVVVVMGPVDRLGGFSGLAVFGSFAVVAGGFAIVVNVPLIYTGSVVRSERYAVRERIGAWRLIRATTILTTASWIAYCAFGVFFITQSMWF
ncbi:hypothetical protein [Agromyces sp. NPDC058110]|uniref:hypothetical protein n=1 Tax=Agromyces sp. NPDC058110 TaxID=3346345 RepID=UPI0036DF0C2C